MNVCHTGGLLNIARHNSSFCFRRFAISRLDSGIARRNSIADWDHGRVMIVKEQFVRLATNIIALGITLLTAAGCGPGTPPPSHASIIARFNAHRAEFSQLLEMFDHDGINGRLGCADSADDARGPQPISQQRRAFFERVAVRGARSNRSMVAALMARSLKRIVTSGFRWPCRSSAGSRIGSKAFSLLPQTRSEASHRTINAARAASS